MPQDQLSRDLETATRRRQEALQLFHRTLDEYLAEVGLHGRLVNNGMRRAMLLQNFTDACTALGSFMAEERRLIRESLEQRFNQNITEIQK